MNMTVKILVIGPESTGKSTLTQQLADYYNDLNIKSKAVLEFARDWIDNNLNGEMNRLEKEHITLFGKEQMKLAEKYKDSEFDLVISDTDAIVSTIFQKIYFNEVDPELQFIADNEKWDLVLFTQPDVPWVDDGQRNLSEKRKEVRKMFKVELEKRNMKYVEVKGNWEERFKIAVDSINKQFTFLP